MLRTKSVLSLSSQDTAGLYTMPPKKRSAGQRNKTSKKQKVTRQRQAQGSSETHVVEAQGGNGTGQAEALPGANAQAASEPNIIPQGTSPTMLNTGLANGFSPPDLFTLPQSSVQSRTNSIHYPQTSAPQSQIMPVHQQASAPVQSQVIHTHNQAPAPIQNQVMPALSQPSSSLHSQVITLPVACPQQAIPFYSQPPNLNAQQPGLTFAAPTPYALTSVCDPLGSNIPIATKEKIWKGEFVELSALLSSERPVRSQQQQRWAFSTQGQSIIAQQAAEEGKEIKGIFSWTNAFLIFASVFLEKHAGRAQELIKYAASIREFAQKMPNTAWLKYDHDFRRKMARNPQALWSSIDMELYAKMLLQSTPNIGWKPATPSAAQQTPQRNFRSQGRTCFAYNAGTCTKTDSACQYAHRCQTCNKPGHPRGRCFASSCKKCGKRGHSALSCSKPGPPSAPSAKLSSSRANTN